MQNSISCEVEEMIIKTLKEYDFSEEEIEKFFEILKKRLEIEKLMQRLSH